MAPSDIILQSFILNGACKKDEDRLFIAGLLGIGQGVMALNPRVYLDIRRNFIIMSVMKH